MKDELHYWLALHRAPGVGTVAFARLLEQFGSAEAVFSRGRQSLSPFPDDLKTYLREPDWPGVEQDLLWAEGSDRHILTWEHPLYPDSLKEAGAAPAVLFVHGDPELLGQPQLAIVGSRNPSVDGRQNAFQFARYLASRGLVITSGLALGIDAASHEGALAAEGLTIAVTGTGLDRVYPARNRALAHTIVEQGGALVSEFSIGSEARRENFPRRNRLISGLSIGTLVVEAARQSGSLITARLAGEQGREVFAIPGSIHNPLSRGCHQLIREGAKLVETAEDIFEEIAGQITKYDQAITSDSAEPREDAPQLDDEYRHLLDCMGFDPQPVDLIIERSGLTPEAVSSMLLVLELQGLVQPSTGGRFSRIT